MWHFGLELSELAHGQLAKFVAVRTLRVIIIIVVVVVEVAVIAAAVIVAIVMHSSSSSARAGCPAPALLGALCVLVA